jgi:hypothetical protein
LHERALKEKVKALGKNEKIHQKQQQIIEQQASNIKIF